MKKRQADALCVTAFRLSKHIALLVEEGISPSDLHALDHARQILMKLAESKARRLKG